jgi:hypothetical protein
MNKSLKVVFGISLSFAFNPAADASSQPAKWRSTVKPIAAVVCFANVDDLNTAKRSLKEGAHPQSRPWQESAVQVSSLAVHEYLIPVGFPPKPRELRPMSGNIAQDIQDMIAATRDRSRLDLPLAQALSVNPLSLWRASKDIRRQYAVQTSISIDSKCLVTEIATATPEGVYYDEVLWSKTTHEHRIGFVTDYIVTQSFSDKFRDQTALRGFATMLLGRTPWNGLSNDQLLRLLVPLRLEEYLMPVTDGAIWICGDSFDSEGRMQNKVALSRQSSLKLSGWDVTLVPQKTCGYLERDVEFANGQLKHIFSGDLAKGALKFRGASLLIDEQGISSIEGVSAVEFNQAKWFGYAKPVMAGDSLTALTCVQSRSCAEEQIQNAQGKFGPLHPATITFFPNSLSIKTIDSVQGRVWFDGKLNESRVGTGKAFGVELDESGRVIKLL